MADKRFSRIMNRIAGAFHVPSREELETAYLNGATSLVDLENRQREIDRGRFRHF